ncbi:scopoletin glucosyltransferase-like [Gastrolobium bilobum]|uniref:scopoletin glucosyltransferase-like n=1 Tax=Gastrolobium bilobum TaxID=150636 RepID=UPI002AB0DF94|nr:scopoletin glucosyltransferase-like [Gastrolobium bilobum]
MDGGCPKLHIMFFPYLAHGHMIPTADMARQFIARGVRATIVTTPLNAPTISRTIGKDKDIINIRTIKFPCAEVGLPEGCENAELIPSPSMVPIFIKATAKLQGPLEQLLHHDNPDCLIASAFFPWANDSAAKFKIPRLVFHGTGVFALCASECVRLYEPHKNVSSDSEPFVIPHLPGEIKMTRMVLPDYFKSDGETELTRAMEAVKESEVTSFGVVVNSFYELEHVYADYYNKVQGRKAWYIGPVSLCSRDGEEKGKRGKQASIDEGECLKWLHSKKPNTVVYVCFGSLANFGEDQLKEIATGLEASGQQFIWVVRGSEREEWLPEGFERRTEGRGIIIRGWAPQVLILDHEAVGGFVTHCGWNSTLEAVSAGVPMVTWPVSAEQFYNEKLVTELLKIGVPVGVKKWARVVGDSITSNALEKALNRIMVGEEAEAMRNRAHKLAQMATTAVKEEGTSYSHLTDLIQDLRSYSMR